MLSEEDWNLAPINWKSVTLVCAVGNPPSQIPATVLIPAILIASALTIESTIAKLLIGVEPVLTAGFVYDTRSPFLSFGRMKCQYL